MAACNLLSGHRLAWPVAAARAQRGIMVVAAAWRWPGQRSARGHSASLTSCGQSYGEDNWNDPDKVAFRPIIDWTDTKPTNQQTPLFGNPLFCRAVQPSRAEPSRGAQQPGYRPLCWSWNSMGWAVRFNGLGEVDADSQARSIQRYCMVWRIHR